MPIIVNRLRVLLLWLAVATATRTAPASAATWWWDTTTTGLWTDGANWSNNATSGGTTGTVPTNDTTTDNVVFNQSSVNGDLIVQLNADRSIRGIVIANTGSTMLQSDSATPRLLTLGADGMIVNAGAGAVTLGSGANPLNLAVSVTGSMTNNSSSLVTVNGNISRTAGDTTTRRLNIGGTGNTLLNGVVSNGGASGALELFKIGTGTLTLTGANTYTGTTTLAGGMVNLGRAESAGVSGPLGVSGTILFGTTVGGGGGLQYSAANQFDYSSRFSSVTGQQFIVDTNGQSVTWATGAPTSTTSTLTKLGSGTLTLSGNNGWQGLTTISAGVLATSAADRISNSSIVSVASGATFRIGGADSIGGLVGSGTVDLGANKLTLSLASSGTFAGLIVGTGILGVSGNGDFYITGSNSYSGGTDLRAARTFIGNDLSLGTGPIAFGAFSATTLASADGTTRTLANNLSSGGANTWTFGTATTGNLIFTGTWTSNPVAANTITVANALTQFNNGLSGGTAIRTKLGAGTLAVGGSSGYTGTTNVHAGTLQLGIGSTDGTLSLSSVITGSAGATFSVNRTNTVTQGVDFRDGITGGINVAQVGSGTLVLGGTNTYTGTTGLHAGTLLVNSGSALAGGGSITFAGGTLMYSGANQADFASRIVGSAAAISINTNGQNVSWSSPLANTNIGGLSKLGSGTLALLGVNTYSGQTTISAGVLALGVNGSFANSSMIKVGDAGSTNAVLDLTAKTSAFSLGTGQTLAGGGSVLVAPSQQFLVQGTFSPGNSPGLFTFDGGTTVLSGTTVMEIFGSSRATSPSHGGGFYDAVDIVDNGTLQFGGNLTLEFSSLFDNNSTFNLFTPASGSFLTGNFTSVTVVGGFYTGLTWNQTGSVWKSSNTTAGGQSLEFNATNGQLVIVPEPGAIALAGIGIGVAALVARSRRRDRRVTR